MFWLKITVMVATNTASDGQTSMNVAGICPQISLKISSRVTLTNVKVPTQTVVISLAAMSPCNATTVLLTSRHESQVMNT